MKNLIFLVLPLFVLAACVGGGKNVEQVKSTAPAINADSLSMVESVHQFFKWYEETGKQLITKIDFVDRTGMHAKLDLVTLGKYLGEFSRSGAICTEFTQNETIYYRACAFAWENQQADQILTGFDIDRYYCQSGGDVREFQTAGITFKINGDRALIELLLDPKGPNDGPRSFEMKKENGKWLLSKNGCNAVLGD